MRSGRQGCCRIIFPRLRPRPGGKTSSRDFPEGKALTDEAWIPEQNCSSSPPRPPGSSTTTSPPPSEFALRHLSRCSRGWFRVLNLFYGRLDVQLAPIELTKTLRSGISSIARAARPAFAATPRRAIRPAFPRFPAAPRFASTTSVGDGKIHQVRCRDLSLQCCLFPAFRLSGGVGCRREEKARFTNDNFSAGHWCRRRRYVKETDAPNTEAHV